MLWWDEKENEDKTNTEKSNRKNNLEQTVEETTEKTAKKLNSEYEFKDKKYVVESLILMDLSINNITKITENYRLYNGGIIIFNFKVMCQNIDPSQ